MRLNEKAKWLYIMMDKKSPSCALIKTGLSADTLRNRFHNYLTGNPWLVCVAVCEVRRNQSLEKVEKLFHQLCEEKFTHECGEWYVVKGKEEITKIRELGFDYFEELNGRIKSKEMINKKISELWNRNKKIKKCA